MQKKKFITYVETLYSQRLYLANNIGPSSFKYPKHSEVNKNFAQIKQNNANVIKVNLVVSYVARTFQKCQRAHVDTPKVAHFGESNTGAATILESPSNIKITAICCYNTSAMIIAHDFKAAT